MKLSDDENFAYVMPRSRSSDIDSMIDFFYAEYFVKNQYNNI